MSFVVGEPKDASSMTRLTGQPSEANPRAIEQVRKALVVGRCALAGVGDHPASVGSKATEKCSKTCEVAAGFLNGADVEARDDLSDRTDVGEVALGESPGPLVHRAVKPPKARTFQVPSSTCPASRAGNRSSRPA